MGNRDHFVSLFCHFADLKWSVTFWHYIRIVVIEELMKVHFNIKKVHIILTALIILNIVAYFTVSAFSKQAQQEVSDTQVITEQESYFHSGVKVLSWSYNMIQYFRHKGSENTAIEH